MDKDTRISLCITTKNRFDNFLSKYLDHYLYFLKSGFIDEIVISDETGDDYQKIQNKYNNLIGDNFRIYKNESILGVFLNKIRVCKLAKYPFIALIDSDNFPDNIYFDTVKKFILSNTISNNVILAPSFAKPNLNFSKYSGKIVKSKLPILINELRFEQLLNDGNYIISKSLIDNLVFDSDPKLQKVISACDVIFFNLLCFEQFPDMEFYVINGMEYEHVVHSDSEWVKTHHNCSNYLNEIVKKRYSKL
jgi:hypothetical protein